MSDLADKVRRDYEVVKGIVTASYDDFMRVRKEDGSALGFKIKGPATALQPGTQVGIVAHRGTDQAIFLVDRQTGQRFDLSIWHNQAGKGSSFGSIALRIVALVLLLIPFLGQFTALFGGLGAIVGGLIVSSSMQGQARAPISRILISLGIYFFGSVVFFSGWFGGDSNQAVLGYAILAVGALAYTFWVHRPATQYYVEVSKLLDEAAA
ncbi:MAG: hypothetical protein WDM86_08100 [Rhizomicrobium sp.]